MTGHPAPESVVQPLGEFDVADVVLAELPLRLLVAVHGGFRNLHVVVRDLARTTEALGHVVQRGGEYVVRLRQKL